MTSPLEILRWLEAEPGAWQTYLSDHDGSLVVAAYNLACIKNEVRGRTVPTRVEVHVAAREIAERTLGSEFVPNPEALAVMAEDYGLPIV